MRCRRCDAPLRAEQRFCSQCGAAAPVACAACAFQNEPGARFCGGCGCELSISPAPAPATLEGAERRQLTVMFCDLADSTALSASLDPEDMRDVIHRYQACAAGIIARYDGFLASYMGDGILVYFGYPRAHEDDAERAIHAALRIVAAVAALEPRPGLRLHTRVGIATGLVVAGDMMGERALGENAIVGDAPNLAARLQALARHDTVVIAPSTRKLVGGQFEYEDLGEHALKGIAQPVRAWRVTGTRSVTSRFEAARSAALSPFVGRVSELELLE